MFINSSWGISEQNMRVVIFWTMCRLSLGREKKALLNTQDGGSTQQRVHGMCAHKLIPKSANQFVRHNKAESSSFVHLP